MTSRDGLLVALLRVPWSKGADEGSAHGHLTGTVSDDVFGMSASIFVVDRGNEWRNLPDTEVIDSPTFSGFIIVRTTDTRLIAIFLKIVECGGFSAAQDELGLDLSTISGQMSVLEGRLGVRLCERGRGGFRLTDSGQRFHESAQRLSGAIARFEAESGELRDELAGDLHIGLVDGIVTSPGFALHESIRRFDVRRHNVNIRLFIEMPRDLVRGVQDGRLHMAITSIHARRVRGLHHERFFEEDNLFYCGNGHRLFARPDSGISLRDIYDSHLIAPVYSDPPHLEKQRFAHATLVGNVEARLIYLLSGDYVGYLPSHVALPWVRAGSLRPLMPVRLRERSPFYIIKRRGISATRALDSFIEDIRATWHGCLGP